MSVALLDAAGRRRSPATVPALHRIIRGQRSLALSGMNDYDSVREVAERAGVIDVQMGLDDVRDIVGTDPELSELGLAVLCFAHMNLEHVRQPTPVRVRVARHRERVPAVDDDEALGMRPGHGPNRMPAEGAPPVSPRNASQQVPAYPAQVADEQRGRKHTRFSSSIEAKGA